MDLERHASRESVLEVLDRVLAKGILIDASVRVPLIERLGTDARVVIASVDTYLRHAETPGASPSGALERPPEGDRRVGLDRRGSAQRRALRDRRLGMGRRTGRERRERDRRTGPDRRRGADPHGAREPATLPLP